MIELHSDISEALGRRTQRIEPRSEYGLTGSFDHLYLPINEHRNVPHSTPSSIGFLEAHSTTRGIEPTQRIADIILSLLVLLVLIVPIIVISLVVRFDSEGPVFYRQRRVGFGGREFWLYKFRSMVSDADRLKDELIKFNEATGPLFKIKNDPRITRSGRLLRKYSLDELPQLINVIRGEMSLVGPRPALPSEVAKYSPVHLRRLDVIPGITGLGQISGRSDLPFEAIVEMDIDYVEKRSMLQYFKILALTVPAVASTRGAY